MSSRVTTQPSRTATTVAGVLFLLALVVSILGGGLSEAVLTAPEYLANVYPNRSQVIIGVLLELVNAAAVVGIAAALFPVLRRHQESMAVGYVGLRVVEAMVQVVAVISPLAMIALGKAYLGEAAPDVANYTLVGTVLMAARTQSTGLLLPVFFGLGAAVLYIVLYQSRLVPRFISVWGLVGVVGVLALNLLGAFDVSVSAILVAPIILNEAFLAIWLIVKGFSPPAVEAV
jgi:hypothetical protein